MLFSSMFPPPAPHGCNRWIHPIWEAFSSCVYITVIVYRLILLNFDSWFKLHNAVQNHNNNNKVSCKFNQGWKQGEDQMFKRKSNKIEITVFSYFTCHYQKGNTKLENNM